MLLLVGGLSASMGGTGLSGAGSAGTLLGMMLALGSAGVIACSVTMMNRHGARGSSTLNAAVATTISGLPFVPFLVLSPPSAHDVVVVAAITICCWVPACLSNWWAMPRIAPTLGTSIGLNEALVTGAVAWAVLGDRLAPVQLAGGLAVGLAVLPEARIHVAGAAGARPRRGAPRRGGGHGRAAQRPASRGIVVKSYRRVTRPVRVHTRARRIGRV
jgi:drug/metabolite transporter (DMT)-like permease